MGTFKRIITLSIFLMAFAAFNIQAQSPQVEFTFVKSIKESNKIEIEVNILDGEGPYKYIIYQGDPLEKGVSLKEGRTSLKEFTISFENKSDLYLYIASENQGKQKSFRIVPLK